MNHALRVQYACAIADRLLGLADLAALPPAAAGFRSALAALPEDAASALDNLRHAGIDLTSRARLRGAVQDGLTWEDEHGDEDDYREPPYEIGQVGGAFPFRLRPGVGTAAADALIADLEAMRAAKPHTLSPADPKRPFRFNLRGEDAAAMRIADLAGFDPGPAPQHDGARRPQGPITITLDELHAIALNLDAIDAADPTRTPGNWASRLREEDGRWKFELSVPAPGGLAADDLIELTGLKHLIGLPGTGKSTIITLLLVLLAQRGLRVAALLPSIEACLSMLADLRRYGIAPGLLVGQSPDTRIDHANRLAERLGADENRGLGRTVPGADLLGLSCALAGFVDDEDIPTFPHLDPPCRELLQAKLRKDGSEKAATATVSCPLAARCGRQAAARSLVEANVWLGHVLSTDTAVPVHFSQIREHYFELIARSLDVVIIDEADGAQRVLDDRALAVVDITGSSESLEARLFTDLFVPRAHGGNDAVSTGQINYASMATSLVDLNRRLVAHLQRERRRNGETMTLTRFRDGFITGNRILAVLYLPADIDALPEVERQLLENRLAAIGTWWDAAMADALRARDDDEPGPPRARIAHLLGLSETEMAAAGTEIYRAAADWLGEQSLAGQTAALERMRAILFRIAPPLPELPPAEAAQYFVFLVHVTVVVMQFLALMPVQQAMVAEGVHAAPVIRRGVSPALARTVPEALVGRLAGIRFSFRENGGRPQLIVSYVSFRATPRLLPWRLAEPPVGEPDAPRPAVLLASATSQLAESPTFHIPVGPHYVLRRNDPDEGWRGSRFAFAPIADPADPGRKLRWSGAPLARRDAVLRAMIDHYYRGESPLVQSLSEDFDPGRKVAFVVNSYDQVETIKRHLATARPDLAPRMLAVCREAPARNDGDRVTAAQIESIGGRDDWDSVIFPMAAVGRGVNIVFPTGPRRRDAAIGTVIFLTRPHPASDSLSLVAGLAGRAGLAFDRADHSGEPLDRIAAAWASERAALMTDIRRLLRFSLMSSRLGPLAVPFTADNMIDVLQTIGRGMRNGCPVRTLFVDAAWAPRSALGDVDNGRTSMLVLMRDILRRRLADPDPFAREVYRSLYEPFLHPLENCANLVTEA